MKLAPEVIIPHDRTRGVMTAVRRTLIQSSLAALQQFGHFERYRTLVAPKLIAELSDAIGPGWVPIDQAITHYRACDALKLSPVQIDELGARVGDKVQSQLLVLTKEQKEAASGAVWSAMGAFSRMGRRIYIGSSAQYVRLTPTDLQIETVENPLFSIAYYREAHASSLRTALRSIGVETRYVKMMSYRRDGLEVEMRLGW